MPPVILYGAPHPLYAGKTRAYLRKQGIPYVERSTLDPRFRNEVVPRDRAFRRQDHPGHRR